MKELLTLIPYLRRHLVPILWGLLLVVLANAFTLAAPYFIKRGIDAIGAVGAERGDVVTFAVLVVVTAILGGAARYGMRDLLNGVSRRVEFDLGNDLFGHLVHLDAPFYGRTPTGDIMSRMTNDLSAVRMAAGPAYMYLVNTLVGTIIALSLMVWIDPWLTLVSILPMLALPPVTIGFGRIIHLRFEKIQEQLAALATMAQENLAGIRIVKAYGREEQQVERMEGLSAEYLERNMGLARVSGLFHPVLSLFSGFAMVLALLVGGRAAMAGSISVGDFVAFILYLGMLSWPMIALGWVVNLFQRGAASMARINRILAEKPHVTEAEHPVEVMEIRGEVEFRDVTFTYPGSERPILSGISFHIPAGKMLAVVGATGSGKSTLVALLARLHDPTAGEVLLDGVSLRDLPLDRVRASIGVVPQDAFLFSDTIRENLALGVDEGDAALRDERVHWAAGIAQLDRTIDRLPHGYDTLLGERGVNLSGGQKQRATLARAIARDPKVLVLDDSLSAVDTHTEAEILAGLRGVLSHRTSIVVSHRVSAVMAADQIIVLDEGRVVESGQHAELIRRGGVYSTLLRRQLLADDVAQEGVLASGDDGI